MLKFIVLVNKFQLLFSIPRSVICFVLTQLKSSSSSSSSHSWTTTSSTNSYGTISHAVSDQLCSQFENFQKISSPSMRCWWWSWPKAAKDRAVSISFRFCACSAIIIIINSTGIRFASVVVLEKMWARNWVKPVVDPCANEASHLVLMRGQDLIRGQGGPRKQ